jgi:putative Holliday junction resolvase
MRILGIDYGDARIGIALSDELEILASPLETYKSQSMRKDIDYVANIAKKHNCGKIVIGLPLNMNGTEGARVEKTKAFGSVLERVSSLPVVYKDERLTTVQVERVFDMGNVKKDKRKQIVDRTAAVLILQSYLDTKI